jgi:hypothetical protein
MGLDAVVFCNCVENKKIKVPHPFPRLLYVSSNGCPQIRTRDAIKIAAHDEWMEIPPCKHGSMQFDGCSLGSGGAAIVISAALYIAQEQAKAKFPILLKKVFYSGTHTGDFLSLAQVRKLDVELKQFRKLKLTDLGIGKKDAKWMSEIFDCLARIVKVALKVGKPIAF